MRTDYYPARYTPNSPLSPRMADRQPLSPPPSRHAPALSKPTTRNFHLDIPAYSHKSSHGSAAATPPSQSQSPALPIHRRSRPHSPTLTDAQQRVMSRGQRDFLKQLQLSSTLAASPMTSKPGAPRLDPLGSPKGAVTPLALEQAEASDYFLVVGSGKFSPASSPGRRSRIEGHTKEETSKTKLTLYR